MRRKLLRYLPETQIRSFPDRLLYCGGPGVIEAMEIMRNDQDKPENKTVILNLSKGAYQPYSTFAEKHPSTGSGLRFSVNRSVSV